MTTPDELERAVERLNDDLRLNRPARLGTVAVSDRDLRALLSERAELLATVECLLDALRLAVGPLGSTGPTPVYEAVLAAILKANHKDKP